MITRCKPLTKDHLPLKTTFPGTKGWSLVTGFTVQYVSPISSDYTQFPKLALIASILVSFDSPRRST